MDKIVKWASGPPDKQPCKYEVGKSGVVKIIDISVDSEGIWERGYRVEFDDKTYLEIWNIPGVIYFEQE